MISQNNLHSFTEIKKNELSPVTDMLTFVKKGKQKVAVTHENGKINFFEVVNMNINYEFQIAGRHSQPVYFPQITNDLNYIIGITVNFQDVQAIIIDIANKKVLLNEKQPLPSFS